jgi:hypothetical protein
MKTLFGKRYCLQLRATKSLGFALCVAMASIRAVFALDPPPGGAYPNDTTALGSNALFNLDPDSPYADNTAIGFEALYNASTTSGNTAVGSQAMFTNTAGEDNVAVGFSALYHNTTGTFNVAVGNAALITNTTGGDNTGIGTNALEFATTAIQNTAVGSGAMTYDETGIANTAIGAGALAFNATGSKNAALGVAAMDKGSGDNNVSLGYGAGYSITGSGNILIGYEGGFNLTSGANNIEVGNQGVKNDANLIRIGDTAVQKKTFIAGISGATIPNGVAIMVNNKGQLGVATSSARFKDDIQPMKNASDVILSLQPVTFRYKKELDSSGAPQFGLVAEQVAKVDPDLVVRDDSGKPYTVRYEAVNAMLLNEFLKEHQKVETQSQQIESLEKHLGEQGKINTEMRAALKAQAAQIQKVNAQLATQQSAPPLVSNPK